MNSDIESDIELKGSSSLIRTDLKKRASSKQKVATNLACLTLNEIVKGNAVSSPRNKASPRIAIKDIKLKYEIQLDEIGKYLGISNSKLGKLQAVQLLQGMELEEIDRIKNRKLRESIYAAKASNIEINYSNLHVSSDHLLEQGLDGPLIRSISVNGLDTCSATANFTQVMSDNSEVENFVTSLEIVQASLGITLTASDLSKGISHYRKLYKLNKKLKKVKKNLKIVNEDLDELKAVKNGDKKDNAALNYPELSEELNLRKKELEVSKYAIQNTRSILKQKIDKEVTDVIFTGIPATATLAGAIISEVGTEIAKETGQLVVGMVVGGLQIVDGTIGFVQDAIDLKHLKAEKKEIKALTPNSVDKRTNQVFVLIIQLKSDNLKHYQTRQIYFHMTDDVLCIVEGASGIAGEAGAVGAQAVVLGAAASRAILQLGNFLYNHRSDINDLAHLRNPPVFKRIKVAHQLDSLNKDVLENTRLLQGMLKERGLIPEMGWVAINKNIESLQEIEEVLKPKWEFLDAQVAERLMIDRASSKLKEEAEELGDNINAMTDQQFMAFKQELITKGIIRSTSINKNRAGITKDVHKFIKSRKKLNTISKSL